MNRGFWRSAPESAECARPPVGAQQAQRGSRRFRRLTVACLVECETGAVALGGKERAEDVCEGLGSDATASIGDRHTGIVSRGEILTRTVPVPCRRSISSRLSCYCSIMWLELTAERPRGQFRPRLEESGAGESRTHLSDARKHRADEETSVKRTETFGTLTGVGGRSSVQKQRRDHLRDNVFNSPG